MYFIIIRPVSRLCGRDTGLKEMVLRAPGGIRPGVGAWGVIAIVTNERRRPRAVVSLYQWYPNFFY